MSAKKPTTKAQAYALVDNYSPKGRLDREWHPVMSFVRNTAKAAVDHGLDPRPVLTHLTNFAIWAAREGLKVDDSLLNHQTIAAFRSSGLPGASRGTRSTASSSLISSAEAVSLRTMRPVHKPGTRRGRKAPTKASTARTIYSEETTSQMCAVADAQPSPLRRADFRFVMAAGLGLGLYSREMARLLGTDVRREPDGCIVVTVHGPGVVEREIVATRAHEKVLWELAQAAGEGLLLAPGSSRGLPGMVTRVLAECKCSADQRPKTAVLRSTWIVRHLRSGTPVDVLLAAAGLQNIGALDDWTPYLLEPDAVARRKLRGKA